MPPSPTLAKRPAPERIAGCRRRRTWRRRWRTRLRTFRLSPTPVGRFFSSKAPLTGEAPGRVRMAARAVGRGVVGAVDFVQRRQPKCSEPHAWSSTQVADDIRNVIAALRVALEGVGRWCRSRWPAAAERAEQGAGSTQRGVDDTRRAVGLRVFERDRGRHAAAERSGVGQLRDTGGVVRSRASASRGADDRLASAHCGSNCETALPKVKPANWMKRKSFSTKPPAMFSRPCAKSNSRLA